MLDRVTVVANRNGRRTFVWGAQLNVVCGCDAIGDKIAGSSLSPDSVAAPSALNFDPLEGTPCAPSFITARSTEPTKQVPSYLDMSRLRSYVNQATRKYSWPRRCVTLNDVRAIFIADAIHTAHQAPHTRPTILL